MKTLLLILLLLLSSCSDDRAEDAEIFAGETDSKIVGTQPAPDTISNASRGGCFTDSSTRMNSGRRLWKINKPLWKYAKTASVRFNSGYYVPQVITGKANRINSGRGRGFVFRPGETTANIIAIWAPYRDQSTQVTVCLK